MGVSPVVTGSSSSRGGASTRRSLPRFARDAIVLLRSHGPWTLGRGPAAHRRGARSRARGSSPRAFDGRTARRSTFLHPAPPSGRLSEDRVSFSTGTERLGGGTGDAGPAP